MAITGQAIKCMAYNKSAAIKNVMEPRLYPGLAPVNDDGSCDFAIRKAYKDYLKAGYQLVILAAGGGDIDLTAETNANHTYLVVWDEAPTGDYKLDDTKTIVDSYGTCIDVVIMGVLINSDHEIIEHIEEIDFTAGALDDFQNIVTLMFVNGNMQISGQERLIFKNSKFIAGSILPMTLTDFVFTNTRITGDQSVTFNYERNDMTISNCLIDNSDTVDFIPAANDLTMTFENCMIKDCGGVYTDGGGKTGLEMNFKNTIFKDATIEIEPEVSSGDDDTIFLDNCGIGIGEMWEFKYIAVEQGFFDRNIFYLGNPELDFTVIDFTEFVEATLTTDAQAVPFNLYGDNRTRVAYNVTFNETAAVNDIVKRCTGDNYILVVHRVDLEEKGLFPTSPALGKTIYNLRLYLNGGHATAYDFASDENFLIRAVDGDGRVGIFLYFGNLIYPTIFSNIWPDVDYTITHVFQIWEKTTWTALKNIAVDWTLDKFVPYENSEMTGSVTFNNYDEEVLL